MLSPLAVAGRLVVDACQETELVKGHLFLLDAELVLELALCGTLDALDGVLEVGACLAGNAKGVRAAGVGPHVGERDLLRSALLEKQLVLIVEEEDGEGAVQETLFNVGHQVA